jgi:epoxyqueuosine reductase
MLTATTLKAQAVELGFDLCGVAPAVEHAELGFLPDWLAGGYGGTMGYLPRTARRRADVRHVLPSAQTVISLGTVYNTDRPYSTELGDPSIADISRYAWGADYHDVVGSRTRALFEWMRTTSAEPFEGRTYVDTGPVQERVYAQHAGLGWIGKNTCVINPELGSWLFLSEILCSLPLETDSPSLDQCGTCTLCLDACPTGAIVEPWVLDATRCLSYLTIEVKQTIPLTFREALGAHVYGCDICQDVCPWNAQAARTDDVVWQPHAAFDRPALTDLWGRPDSDLAPIVAKSAMSHTGLRNLRRNTAVALGNSGTAEAQHALAAPAAVAMDADSIVTEHVAWAREKLEASRTDVIG